MLRDVLKHYEIILASGSPRRQSFFKELEIDFKVELKPIEEVFPENLKSAEISDYLAKLKAKAFLNQLKPNQILVTSDTIVWHNENALGKPKNKEEAIKMLEDLSGKSHEVITSVCLSTPTKQAVFNDTTKVTFKTLTLEEIIYYVENFQPYDKAGAYGIQEWIGAIGITKIEGSYNNVVGLPTEKLYETLNAFAKG